MHHACSFHETVDEQMLVALTFVNEGVRLGERCVIVSDDADTWRHHFPQAGQDEQDPGQTISLWALESWPAPGRFNSITMARRVWQMIEESLARYPGLRVLVDMNWTLEDGITSAAVCHWEATLDALIPKDKPVRILCQYSLDLPVATLHAGLRTHPCVAVGGRLEDNPYYEAPAILDNEPHLSECSSDPDLIRGLLAHFHTG
jgi:DcmR-like sensory protein